MRLAALISVMVVTTLAYSTDFSTTETVITEEGALENFVKGNLQFTAKLYNEVLRENPNKNFIFSPFSIEVILALTRAGAKGLTANEFSSALNFPSEKETEMALKKYLPTLKSTDEGVKLLSANKLYLGKQFKILDSFKSLAVNTFNADIENVDFAQGAEAAEKINNWVENQTNNKIKDLISPDAINVLTRLILVNALYFSGKWAFPFEKDTRKEKFYLSNTKSKEVDMMYIEESFRYHENRKLNAKFLELPYEAENVSMIVVLPNEREGLASLEANLEEVLRPQPLDWQRVYVKMPSFLVESELKLKPILQRLGVRTAFSDYADLSGISAEALKIDDVFQKAFINVTTAGTEAAAATFVRVIEKSLIIKEPSILEVRFSADHPFLYCLRVNGIIGFVGRVSQA
ncbi:antichymotrypsin-2-like isoform X3 [Anthonomus grandis grandis]|uniref:antichymotrypsin-2-like isoform X3 n=1 Tax=Anthonomus grandis grandis TaxID=2921223 RepID=UPI0021656077|nr:antichymotrypsin-2-like isoform X3 [Anthonomus grandis grandis]